jgi:predicted phosphoribosyltransferase
VHRYADRVDAGRRLAAALPPVDAPVVLGLPRGGVVVAAQVVGALGGDLGVVVVRKLGSPENPEYAVGALAEDDEPLWDDRALAVLRPDPFRLDRVLAQERHELERRRQLYRGGPLPHLAGRDVLVVDDGLATGSTARAALRRVRREAPARLLLAVPVGSPDTVRALAAEADLVVCPLQPPDLGAVGAYYDDFSATTDAEVLALLGRGAAGYGAPGQVEGG